MPTDIAKGARDLRERLGLSIEQAAEAMGLSAKRLAAFERAKPLDGESIIAFDDRNHHIIERYYATFGIDLYMFVMAYQSDETNMLGAMREPARNLARLAREHIEAILADREGEEWKQ